MFPFHNFFKSSSLYERNCTQEVLCRPAGGGHPGGVQYSGPVFIAAVPAVFALHRVLCLQALEKEEEKEEEKEPRSA